MLENLKWILIVFFAGAIYRPGPLPQEARTRFDRIDLVKNEIVSAAKRAVSEIRILML
jgi:hypothetical protein